MSRAEHSLCSDDYICSNLCWCRFSGHIARHIVNHRIKCHVLNTVSVLMITSVVIYVGVVLVDI